MEDENENENEDQNNPNSVYPYGTVIQAGRVAQEGNAYFFTATYGILGQKVLIEINADTTGFKNSANSYLVKPTGDLEHLVSLPEWHCRATAFIRGLNNPVGATLLDPVITFGQDASKLFELSFRELNVRRFFIKRMPSSVKPQYQHPQSGVQRGRIKRLT